MQCSCVYFKNEYSILYIKNYYRNVDRIIMRKKCDIEILSYTPAFKGGIILLVQ